MKIERDLVKRAYAAYFRSGTFRKDGWHTTEALREGFEVKGDGEMEVSRIRVKQRDVKAAFMTCAELFVRRGQLQVIRTSVRSRLMPGVGHGLTLKLASQ